jgi:predicted phosphoribosyltransferase
MPLTETVFRDRQDAGRRLAAQLEKYRDRNPIVLGLPRGGVPVAFEIARELNAPLDVIVARKIGAPMQPELGIGAIAQGDVMVLDHDTIRYLGLSRDDIARAAQIEISEMRRRLEEYRGDAGLPDVSGRTVILVDDGLATGVTMIAALKAVRQGNPDRIVIAVPVCARETVRSIERMGVDVVCSSTPEYFRAVGIWYRNFTQTSDAEVIELLEEARGQVSMEDLDEL